MDIKKLAIIIPAYKDSYLAASLESIANQSNQNFTVYIGDDCSPYALKTIVDSFQERISIVYHRFETNLGGKDLVAQWERCIDMNQGEEWIWLFSDDDTMDSNCVEEFYKMVADNAQAKLIHFNVNQINKEGILINYFQEFGHHLTAKEYLDGKLTGRLVSFVVEFIIHRNIFYECQRFQNFDQAWGSDFISWIKFAKQADGIYTCPNALVYWRSSGENVSTDESNASVFRKMKAVVQYTSWIFSFAIQEGYGHPYFYSKYALGELIRRRKQLTNAQIFEILNAYLVSIKGNFCRICLDIIKYPFYKKSI